MNWQSLKQNLLLNKTPLLIVFLVIATVSLVVLALSAGKITSPSPQKVSDEETVLETSLSLGDPYQIEEEATASNAAEAGSSSREFFSDVNITTGGNKVTAVQLEIKYNPDLLTNVDIFPGDFFQNPAVLLERIDAEEGIISYALGSDGGVSAEGIVAILSFEEKTFARGETSLDFLSKTAVSAEGAEESVLREMAGVEFTLSRGSATSPSAKLTPTP